MKTTLSRGSAACILACLLAGPVHGQQLIDDWLARTTATPDALVSGAAAVFRNPALLPPVRRAEALLVDMRGPDITGISGVAGAAAYRLDGRTSVALGYQHVGLDGIELTSDSPDEAMQVSIGQDLFAVGASHALRTSVQFGAGVQYVRAADFLNAESLLRLAVGAQWQGSVGVPVTLAATAQSQESGASWAVAARAMPPIRLEDWSASATYGAAGGRIAPGVTHRGTAEIAWRDMVSLQLGAVAEPESDGHSVSPIGALGVRVNRYEVGVVRESLSNEFGAVHTFRIGVLF